MSRVFLLSPAHCGGLRAQLLLREEASFGLAERLRSGETTLGETFSFLSGLYFRGKLTYATTFTSDPADRLVITTHRGLVRADAPLTRRALQAFGKVDIDVADPRYSRPLQRDAKRLLARLGDREVVLLGSIASKKYVELLTEIFGARLLFPSDFVGRGDMSRGGLLLRAARAREELRCEPVRGAVRTGRRPPKLARLR